MIALKRLKYTGTYCIKTLAFVFALCILLGYGLSSCDNFQGPAPGITQRDTIGTTPINNGNPCDTVNVSFSKTVLPILEAQCGACHSGSFPTAGVTLTNHASVRQVVSSGRFPDVLTAGNGRPQMPPGSRLSACDIAKIQAWVRKGAAND